MAIVYLQSSDLLDRFVSYEENEMLWIYDP